MPFSCRALIIDVTMDARKCVSAISSGVKCARSNSSSHSKNRFYRPLLFPLAVSVYEVVKFSLGLLYFPFGRFLRFLYKAVKKHKRIAEDPGK